MGSFDKRDGFLENGRYIVSWAFGHLVELVEPEDYDEALKRWNIGSLPILPGRFKLNVIGSSRKHDGALKSLLRSNGVSEVVNACDAGREGELIFRRIYEAAWATKPFRRLWLSEATPTAVKDAFRKLRPGRELDNRELPAGHLLPDEVGAGTVDDIGEVTEVFFGVIYIDDLDGLGRYHCSQVPDPRSPVTQKHLPLRQKEAAPGEFADHTLGEGKHLATGIVPCTAFYGCRVCSLTLGL